MGREPFNYKKSSRTPDEPSNIWERMQTEDSRWRKKQTVWGRVTSAWVKFDWAHVLALLAVCAAIIGAVLLIGS